jgi:hypothetical protein
MLLLAMQYHGFLFETLFLMTPVASVVIVLWGAGECKADDWSVGSW